MRKAKRFVIPAVMAGILLPVIFYVIVGCYYRNGFSFGTFINGVYCTGKSVEEVNQELTGRYEATSLLIQDAAGREYEIPLSAVSFNVDYSSQLEEIQNIQNAFAWIYNVTGGKNDSLRPQVTFEEDLLKEALSDCGIAQENAKAQTVEIRREAGYVLYDGTREVLSMEKVFSAVADALRQETFFVDVSDCYEDIPYTEEMLETLALWEKVSAFQTCGIVYDMGDSTVAITEETASGWIALNEDGSFALAKDGSLILQEEAVEAFIEELCQTYDTLGSSRTFHATRGEEVIIEGGTYGSVIDKEAELLYLKEAAFLNKVQEVHVPTYEVEAYFRGKDDIGDTYVEIDMTSQKLYFYEKGEMKFETDIVTGNLKRHWGTPSGVNFVYSMQRNRTLRGSNYTSFVKFWVPVKGNIGIHDASWRKEFGGEIYKTNGSHGCINVPRDRMQELYEMLEIGVPVVMFY